MSHKIIFLNLNLSIPDHFLQLYAKGDFRTARIRGQYYERPDQLRGERDHPRRDQGLCPRDQEVSPLAPDWLRYFLSFSYRLPGFA